MLKKVEYENLKELFIEMFGEKDFREMKIGSMRRIFEESSMNGGIGDKINKLYKEYLYKDDFGSWRWNLDDFDDRFRRMVKRLRNM